MTWLISGDYYTCHLNTTHHRLITVRKVVKVLTHVIPSISTLNSNSFSLFMHCFNFFFYTGTIQHNTLRSNTWMHVETNIPRKLIYRTLLTPPPPTSWVNWPHAPTQTSLVTTRYSTPIPPSHSRCHHHHLPLPSTPHPSPSITHLSHWQDLVKLPIEEITRECRSVKLLLHLLLCMCSMDTRNGLSSINLNTSMMTFINIFPVIVTNNSP